jgi:hypothetical protein
MELLSLCLLVVGSSITLKKKQKKPRWEVKDSTKIHLENFLARIYSQLHPKKKKIPLLSASNYCLDFEACTQHLTRLTSLMSLLLATPSPDRILAVFRNWISKIIYQSRS